jgi:hypothetical protein
MNTVLCLTRRTYSCQSKINFLAAQVDWRFFSIYYSFDQSTQYDLLNCSHSLDVEVS